MKIGIFTQPLGYNYGGILQNWALQQVLINLGHEPVTIIYFRHWNINAFINDCLSVAKYIIKHLIHHTNRNVGVLPWRRNRFLKQFIKNKLFTTSDIYPITYNNLAKFKFDRYIVGSDQVWRPMYNKGHLGEMYCDFLNDNNNTPCIAYAASFGTAEWEYTDEQTNLARQNIQKFMKVSVREKSGVALCQQYLNVDAELVLDPTLLLEKEDYSSLQLKRKHLKEIDNKFVGVYLLDMSVEKKDIVKRVCALIGKEPRFIGQPLDSAETRPPISEWLSDISNSEFIITDSFHGTAFAINFKKPFIALDNLERGSDRFTSLLDLFNLRERLINPLNVTHLEEIIDSKINWESIERIKKSLVSKSMNFIKESLSIR